MSNLFRNTQIVVQRCLLIRRTATTVVAKNAANLAVRDSLKQSKISDPIRPRAAGELPFMPLVGTALNTSGKIGFGVVFALSAYFIYINYITNPEFYKSLKISREASKRDSHTQPAKEATAGQKH